MVTISLSSEQQEYLKRATGVRQWAVALPELRLAALALAATAEGVDAIPITRQAAMVPLMIRAYRSDCDSQMPVIGVPLTDEQVEHIHRLTGCLVRSLLLAPGEFNVSFHERWGEVPERLGKTFRLVCGDSPVTSDSAVPIYLPHREAGSSGPFGTGRHPTTRLALSFLEDHVRAGDRILDLGTGSGILSVAAARLGASEVLALDVDASAVATALQTVLLNGLKGIITVREGSADAADGEFDMIVANIYANVIVSLGGEFVRLLRPGGILVVSGIIAICEEEVILAMRSHRLEHIESRAGDGPWRGLVFRSDSPVTD